MNSHQENPHCSPDFDNASRVASESDRHTRGVCLRSDLPLKCPSCDHLFNMRYCPRKYQKTTIFFSVSSVFVALFVSAFFPRIVSWVVFVIVASSLGGIGMKFPKVVYLKCRSCGWLQNCLVRNPR